MNVIFLDVDGVLNTNTSCNDNLTKYYQTGVWDIDIIEEKVALLAVIAKKYDCKIVLEAACKASWDPETGEMGDKVKYLFELANKYGIEIIDKTPDLVKWTSNVSYTELWKENDIRVYLLRHPEIEHFCIIDDMDARDLEKVKEYVVKTDDRAATPEEEGLTERHIEEVGKVLTLENKYRKRAK